MKTKTMWGFALLVMASATTMAAVGQTSATVKDDLFSGTEIFAKGATDVTEISMDPDTLGLVSGKDGKKAHSMILNVVRTYEYDKAGMYRIEDVDAFRNKLNTGEWHCSIHTRDLKNGESTDVCNKRRADDLSETAIITVEPKELTFIHTIRKKGNSESELSGLPMMMGMPGITNLAMLDPEMFVDMNMAMARAKTIDMGSLDAQLASAMQNLPKLDSAEMKLKMDEAMKQMEKTRKNFKMDLVMPDDKGGASKKDEPKQPE